MIELANKQYATVIDCVAATAIKVGQAVKLQVADDGETLEAVLATAAEDFDVWGPLFAHWINPRDTTVTYSGGEDGLSYPLISSTDPDSQIHIPSGARMLAVGGVGVTQIRFFKSALDTEFASVLPEPGDVLGISDEKFLCSTGHANVIAGLEKVARVVEADKVSVRCIVGLPVVPAGS